MQAEKKQIERLLHTARGQMDGILKMVEENRYCIDISNQILACQAVLTKANKEILKAHIFNCVVNATQPTEQACGCNNSVNEQFRQKLEEINSLLDKLL